MKLSLSKQLPRKSIVLLALAGSLLVLGTVSAYMPNENWWDTMGGADLHAQSTIWTSYPSWGGGGLSESHVQGNPSLGYSLDTIGLTNSGYEACNYSHYTKWSSPWYRSNTWSASTGGSTTYLGGCYQSCVQSYSSHEFYKSGSFGAYPYTAKGADMDYC